MRPVPEPPCEVIDCHIHPAARAEDLPAWFDPFGTLEAFVALLRAAGVDRACGSCIRPMAGDAFEPVEACNCDALAFREAFPDFYLPAVLAHPRFPEASCRAMERGYAAGARWVGELVGYMMGFADDYLPRRAGPLYERAAELGLPVNVHCGDLGVVERLCRTFPDLNVVLAHPGAAREAYGERLALVAALPNLHLDLSGSGLMRWGMLRHGIDRAGAEKFLFGTDAPICSPAQYTAGVLAEDLTDRERERVFAGNFKRLTGAE